MLQVQERECANTVHRVNHGRIIRSAVHRREPWSVTPVIVSIRAPTSRAQRSRNHVFSSFIHNDQCLWSERGTVCSLQAPFTSLLPRGCRSVNRTRPEACGDRVVVRNCGLCPVFFSRSGPSNAWPPRKNRDGGKWKGREWLSWRAQNAEGKVSYWPLFVGCCLQSCVNADQGYIKKTTQLLRELGSNGKILGWYSPRVEKLVSQI